METNGIGREEAVRILIRERAKLLAYVWTIVRDEHAADDVFQDVIILALQRCGEIESAGHLLGWARRTARFKALKALEASNRRPVTLDSAVLDLLEEHWDEFDRTPAADLLGALKSCLARLTPYAREVVELRYVKGHSGVRVADLLNRKVRTVYVALSRIHRDLGKCIRTRLASAGEGSISGLSRAVLPPLSEESS